MPTGDDRPDDTGSSLLDLGETFLNTFGDGNSGSAWREEVEQTLAEDGDVDYDRLITAGVAAGEQVARLRERSRAPAAPTPDAGPTPIETRDVYDTDGEYAGTRIYVSADDASVYLSSDGSEVVVRTGDTGETVTLPQPATEVVTDDGPLGGMALFVAYPEGSVLDQAPTNDGVEQAPDRADEQPSDTKWMDESRLDDPDGDGDE